MIIGVGFIIWRFTQSPEGMPSTDTSRQPAATSPPQASPEPTEKRPVVAENPPVNHPGRYTEYDAAKLSDTGYTIHILFFHAPWCPECRAFETAIQDSAIPDGVQLLKVDYDSAKELRKQHGVTTQTTFVRVDNSGAQQAKWVGYGKDKSIAAIIENTR